MRLSEIKQTLSDHSLQLSKSLGQNFLHDANQLRRIVKAGHLGSEDKVLEIGPGLGPLTELLLEHAGSVLAIEKDARLVQILRQRFALELAEDAGPNTKLCLVHDDALHYLKQKPKDWSGWKVVSNLPYAVASPILVELALGRTRPNLIVATLQIEVAKRLMAKASTPDYGVLTLLVQLEYTPVDWFKIPASCFFPEPDVDSGCIALARRNTSLLDLNQREIFISLVKRSFSQRRKMMAKLLKPDWPAGTLDRAFASVPLDPRTRAEAVNLQQFVALTRALHERRDI